jgi:hypothetical protein
MTLPWLARDSRVLFVRCELFDGGGNRLAENVDWQSQQRDDVGDPRNDAAFDLTQISWADMTPLNSMRRVKPSNCRRPCPRQARHPTGYGVGGYNTPSRTVLIDSRPPR